MAKRYGRGKFEASEKYIRYMEMIVERPEYHGMPNAVSEDGRVNWQVSSGKTTSFYEYYLARFDWWKRKADELGLSGAGNSDDRFSVAARLIHPTRRRPCRLCGRELYVGYMYVNSYLARRWNKIAGSDILSKGQEVVDAAQILLKHIGHERFLEELRGIFGERCEKFNLNEVFEPSKIREFFEVSGHIRSNWLSPGFMSNPPDRLDGFHDYGLCCRKEKDPGRSDENLRTYVHDRRAFQWWTEGDWKVADSLYNSAGPGICDRCGKKVTRISPDHVGPLACGFKQVPFFTPLCNRCNSSRNRRINLKDVKRLVDFEIVQHDSVASWQIRAFWDMQKSGISSDEQSEKVSSILRSIEDYYLRVLHLFLKTGHAHFISSFLSPHYAHYEIRFVGLDPSTLRYTSFSKIQRKTSGTRSLAARSVRIAFEELEAYCRKSVKDRKLFALQVKKFEKQLEEILELADKQRDPIWSERWMQAIESSETRERREQLIVKLLEDNYPLSILPYERLRTILMNHFDHVGKAISV
jgi:Alw26I/Eco31I/Esp3I family type II restriction endonuclease